MFMEYAAVLLVRELESPQVTAASPPQLIRGEINLWRSQLQLFNDLMPEKMWMVNLRLNQLSALLPESNKKDEGANQPSSPQDRLKKLIADAESAIGARRDELFDSAAYAALRMGDFDQAISLIERIENREYRELEGAYIWNAASMKALNNEGPDRALTLARGIKWPSTRIAMFSRIRTALLSLGKREQAAELLDELSVWLDNYDNNTDKVWGLLTYLDHFAKDDSERALILLNTLVSTLNKVDLDPPAKPMPSRFYWYPEFHDFRKSLGSLARGDFERAWQALQLLKNKETLWLVQATLCNEFLKADQQKQAAEAKKVSK
jgi:hypothetical protein